MTIIASSRFREALQAVYLQAPSQTLPNALWKTLGSIRGDCETYGQFEGLRVTSLLMRSSDTLHVLWRRDRDDLRSPPVDVADLKCALLHQDFTSLVPRDHLPNRTAYFRLVHRGAAAPPAMPDGFRVVDVRIKHEAAEVAALIDACYPSISPSIAEVRGWTTHPVYDPTLWVWMMDTRRDRPAALGIAEFDPAIRESSLEWIQVLPRYRGRGLGTVLVRELLARLAGRAAFTMVAGRVDNTTRPERLYRRCGFRGSDVWWVFRA
jgi:GNAT superfamily N-acetyltransferase